MLAAGCSASRTIEAVQVLGDLRAGSKTSWLKRATPEPTRAAILLDIDGRERAADFYAPGDAARAGLVLVPGLTPRGRNDLRVIDFAKTLARARFEVVIPDLPRMRAMQVTALDAAVIADAARWLDERGSGRPLGLAAVSFAVGPAIIALGEPAAAGRVDFFIEIGGYYDLDALITYVTTGFFQDQPGGSWTYRQPKAYGRWVFLLTNAGRLQNAADAAVLLEVAERKLDNPDAEVGDLESMLGPHGQSVYALVANTDPERVPDLIAALPPEVRDEIALLDLQRRDLAALNVEFVLIHDRHDRIIPPSHSEALAAAIAPRAEVYIVDGLDHAQVEEPGIDDALALLSAIGTVLRLRDGGPPR